MSAVHRDAPPPYFSLENGKAYVQTEKFKNYKEYLVELKNLADLGDVESARRLVALDRSKLQACIPTVNSEDVYLDLIGEHGSGKEADQACKRYMGRYDLSMQSLIRKTYKDWDTDLYDNKDPDLVRIFYGLSYGSSASPEDKSYPYKAEWFRITGDRSDRETAKKFFNIAQEKGFISKDEFFGKYESRCLGKYGYYALQKRQERESTGPGCIIS